MIGHEAPAQQTLVSCEWDAWSTTLGRVPHRCIKSQSPMLGDEYTKCSISRPLSKHIWTKAVLTHDSISTKISIQVRLHSDMFTSKKKNQKRSPNLFVPGPPHVPIQTLTPKLLTPLIFRAPRHDRHVPRHRKRHLGVWHGRWNVDQAPPPPKGVGNWNTTWQQQPILNPFAGKSNYKQQLRRLFWVNSEFT